MPATAKDDPGGPDARIRFRNDAGREFLRSVNARVNAHFVDTGRNRFADWRLWLKAALFAGVAIGAYSLILTDRLATPTALGAGIVFAVAVLLLTLNVAHDAAHHALTRHRGINRSIQSAIFMLTGASAHLWQMRHVKSHHVFPNVNGCDIDIDSNVFVRLSPNHPRRFYHRYQYIYAPFIYWLVKIDTVYIKDFQYLFARQLANMRNIRHAPAEFVMFALTKIVYMTIMIVIPTLATRFGLWEVIAANLIMSFVSSILFVLLLIGTHFCEQAKFPTVDRDGTLPGNWATHALATSLDWAPLNRIAHFFVGGLNAHVAHHLFPGVSHIHYQPITRIIQEEAVRHGIPYNETSLPGMIGSHLRFLRRVGRMPAPGPLPDATAAAI